jgi:hypothetical protein
MRRAGLPAEFISHVAFCLRAGHQPSISLDVPRLNGGCAAISASFTRIPEARRHVMAGLAVMMQPHLPLTSRQQERIASVVSARNACFDSTESYAEFLSRVTLERDPAAALRRDDREAELNARTGPCSNLPSS